MANAPDFMKDIVSDLISGNSTKMWIAPAINTGKGTPGRTWTITTTGAPITTTITLGLDAVPNADGTVALAVTAIANALAIGATFTIEKVTFQLTAAAIATATSLAAIVVGTKIRGVAATRSGVCTSVAVAALANPVFRESTNLTANNGTRCYAVADAAASATIMYLYNLNGAPLPSGSTFSVAYYQPITLVTAQDFDMGTGTSEQTDVFGNLQQYATKTGTSYSPYKLTVKATDTDAFVRDAMKGRSQASTGDPFTSSKRAFYAERADGSQVFGFLHILDAQIRDGVRATGMIEVNVVSSTVDYGYANAG